MILVVHPLREWYSTKLSMLAELQAPIFNPDFTIQQHRPRLAGKLPPVTQYLLSTRQYSPLRDRNYLCGVAQLLIAQATVVFLEVEHGSSCSMRGGGGCVELSGLWC